MLEHERKVATLVAALADEEINSILLKGRAAGRFYPEPALRPPGDIDLYLPRRELRRVRAVLNEPRYSGYRVDLEHAEFEQFDDRSFDEFYEHTESIWLEDTEVRVLGPEDHLRFSCLHLLKHGAWRPLWLCDIAAVLERLPRFFDWHRCLGRDEVQARWILCTVGLAKDVLQARVVDPPPELQALKLPGWLVNSLLDSWTNPVSPNLPLFCDQLRQHWRRPRRLMEALWMRWPNPIQATVDVNGQFDERPRWPFQLRNCMSRAARLGQLGVTRSATSP